MIHLSPGFAQHFLAGCVTVGDGKESRTKGATKGDKGPSLKSKAM